MLDIQDKRKIYEFKEVKKIVSDMGYIVKEEDFEYISRKFKVEDSNGYQYLINNDNIRKNNHPKMFARANPFTIRNIKNYIE